MKKLSLIICICLLCGWSSSVCLPIQERRLPDLVDYEIAKYPKYYNYDEACYNVKPTKNDESELYLEFKIITDTDGTQLLPLVHKKSNDNIVVEAVIEELPVNIHHIQTPKNYDTSNLDIIEK